MSGGNFLCLHGFLHVSLSLSVHNVHRFRLQDPWKYEETYLIRLCVLNTLRGYWETEGTQYMLLSNE